MNEYDTATDDQRMPNLVTWKGSATLELRFCIHMHFLNKSIQQDPSFEIADIGFPD